MKGFLVSVHLPDRDVFLEEESTKELEALIKTAQYDIIGQIKVSASQIFAGTFVSQPTAYDVLARIEEVEEETGESIDCIYFNEELGPSQLFKLEKIFDRLIIDRVEMIFRIFELNAKTKEAKIQVEVAQLEYTLPRLKRMWKHLSRIEGGIGFTKGPGETQIEIDRRLIKSRIHKLKKKLKDISQVQSTQRKQRTIQNLPRVSLVGYTNAGKTTLLNLLAKENLYAENKLFATLSTVTRKVYLKEGSFCLVSDTVGFISNLPHFLITSFKSTLMEAALSDFLIILQDASHQAREEQLKVVFLTLKELEADKKPYLLVFTKIDLLDEENLNLLKGSYPQALYISSRNKEGIEDMKKQMIKKMKSFKKND